MHTVEEPLDQTTSPLTEAPSRRILRDSVDEARRTARGRLAVRERAERLGSDSVFNLTGLIRGFPLQAEHLPGLSSQFSYYAKYDGWAEDVAVGYLGGTRDLHSGLILNRVSAATLAVMSALVGQGEQVLSLVPKGRSHPSIERATALAGGRFHEVVGVESLWAWLEKNPLPKLVAITPVTPQKFHMDQDDLRVAIDALSVKGVLVFLDDAHMSARVTAFHQLPSFHMGDVDLSIVSTDKHMFGPRAGALVGKTPLVERVRSFAFEYGLEAQGAHALAAGLAMDNHDIAPIESAMAIGAELLGLLTERFGGCVYPTGVGAAMSEQDLMALARARSGKKPTVAPMDASNAVCMWMLLNYGVATIPTVGMPGSSPALRLMTFPDGHRLGAARIVDIVDEALEVVAGILDQDDAVRSIIFGS